MHVLPYKRSDKTMSVHIQGIGWASPQARNLAELIKVIRHQKNFESSPIVNRNDPRFRRAGRLSQFAWAAVQDAIADADKEWTAEEARRTALIFLSTHGGICHTVRFFEDIAKDGTAAGSPIYFPETVYNACPSHIAANLGIDGMLTSLVGDSSAVGGALRIAEEWLDAGICEQCLLVAAEETHPLLQSAYDLFRFRQQYPGTSAFSDAAAAILVGPYPKGSIIHGHPGMVFRKGPRLLPSLRKLFEETANGKNPDIIFTSALGSILKTNERAAVAQLWPTAELLHPKNELGESFAASSLGHIVLGEALIRHGQVSSALISLVGVYGQASAAFLSSNS
ncbi:MAG: hypothetical protein C5B47_01040 [Verrucomicrobia bacterium]|nr:MAG: hypothetical protein C5B47_01040 [Verrucomicrobiota bacterium]